MKKIFMLIVISTLCACEKSLVTRQDLDNTKHDIIEETANQTAELPVITKEEYLKDMKVLEGLNQVIEVIDGSIIYNLAPYKSAYTVNDGSKEGKRVYNYMVRLTKKNAGVTEEVSWSWMSTNAKTSLRSSIQMRIQAAKPLVDKYSKEFHLAEQDTNGLLKISSETYKLNSESDFAKDVEGYLATLRSYSSNF